MKKRLVVLALVGGLLSVGIVPAQAAVNVLPECTIPVTIPSKLEIRDGNQPFKIDLGNPQDCFSGGGPELVDVSRPEVKVGMASIDRDYDYLTRNVIGWFDDIDEQGTKVPGRYRLDLRPWSVDWDWARARDLYPSDDYYPLVKQSNIMTVKYGAAVSASAARAGSGIALSGKATRFQLTDYVGGISDGWWIAHKGATVHAQKRVGATWVTKKSAKTNAQGAYSIKVADSTAGAWRVVVAETSHAWSKASATRTVGKFVAARTKVTNVKAKRRGKKVTVTALVTSKPGSKYVKTAGAKAFLQAKRSGRWVNVAVVKSSKKGVVKATVKASKKTAYRYKVIASTTVKASVSKAVKK